MSDAGAENWIAVVAERLPVAEALAWASGRECGAVVSFSGSVREASEGRPGVVSLEYEAYEPYAARKMADVVRAVRTRFPEVRRIALLHRIGTLSVGEVSVFVVVSAPHRSDAFEAARSCLDLVKATVPIWKRETWAGGSDWGQGSRPIVDVSELEVP
ncbi:MAG TPA: molybdenum cofactor biosynthesis protein MoaE [Acidimicrobiales bacterium]|nr:molybdenum cofactor biosynthesis protein MoaE [Acidimicrobiales bacterium]